LSLLAGHADARRAALEFSRQRL